MMHLVLSILFYLFIGIGFINLIHFGLYLVGANLYDFQAFQLARRSRRRRTHNPLISILVPAYNEELVIERCLESIRKSSYKKVQIIVNNDASTDKTAEIVHRYGRRYPRLALRLVNRRQNRGKAAGLNYIARRYARGDLVMMLDADSTLEPQALKNLVKYFDNPAVAGVAANVRIMEEPTLIGILQRFEHMISYRSKKFFTVANCELIVGGVASTYRRAVLKKVRFYDTDTVTEDIGLSIKIAAHGNKAYRLIYAFDVAAMTEPVNDFTALLRQRYRWKLGGLQNIVKYRSILFQRDDRYTKSLTFYRMPMAFIGELLILLELFVLAYVLYLSIHYFTIGLVLGAYTTITAYILMSVWPDEHLDLRGKIKASLLAPWLYFIFYIMNAVQVISIIRCLLEKDKIINLHDQKNIWTSPRRLGKAATFS